jgi:hypothetical protein
VQNLHCEPAAFETVFFSEFSEDTNHWVVLLVASINSTTVTTTTNKQRWRGLAAKRDDYFFIYLIRLFALRSDPLSELDCSPNRASSSALPRALWQVQGFVWRRVKLEGRKRASHAEWSPPLPLLENSLPARDDLGSGRHHFFKWMGGATGRIKTPTIHTPSAIWFIPGGLVVVRCKSLFPLFFVSQQLQSRRRHTPRVCGIARYGSDRV